MIILVKNSQDFSFNRIFKNSYFTIQFIFSTIKMTKLTHVLWRYKCKDVPNFKFQITLLLVHVNISKKKRKTSLYKDLVMPATF